MTERKLDIFKMLRATDLCDGDWLSQQPDDAQKEFTPIVSTRWAATLPDGPEAVYMLWMINERVNCHLFDFYHHPDLVYRLIASCGLGQVKKHQYLAAPSRKPQGNAVINLLHEQYPDAKDAEIALLLAMFDRVEFKRFVDGCGVQPEDAKAVMNAYDKLCPTQTPKNKIKA